MIQNTIGTRSIGRENNFNLVRALAALMVIYSHSYAISIGESAIDPLYNIIGISFGTLAVNIFFVTSGFLVFKSFSERPLTYYLQSRVLRIFPGLFICNILVVMFVGLFITTYSLHDYFINSQTFKYVIDNTLLLRKEIQFFLPGTFDNNVFPKSVNGSLWTLPIEVKMYIFIIVIGFFGLMKRKIYFNLIFITLFIFIILFNPHVTVYFQFYFLLGIFIFLNRDYIILNHFWGVTVIVFMILIYFINSKIVVLLLPFLVGYTIFYFTYCFRGIILKYNKFGDYSYGLYIYAFPVQQSIHYFFKPSIHCLFLSSFLITLLLAIFSWHFVEKPMMSLKSNNNLIVGFFKNIRLTGTNNNRV